MDWDHQQQTAELLLKHEAEVCFLYCIILEQSNFNLSNEADIF